MKSELLIFILFAAQAVFPAKNSRTLRQHYDEPKPGIFIVRAGIIANATFGKSGNTCALVIERHKVPSDGKGDQTVGVIDYKLLKQIEDELVPTRERGKYIRGMFLDVLCPPANDCAGTQEDWKKVSVRESAGRGGANYAVIYWNRKECGQKPRIHFKH